MGMMYGWIPPRSKKQPKKPAFRPMVASAFKETVNPRMEEYHAMKESCPSVGDGIGNATVETPVRYQDPELAIREAKARDVKHTVAPICNKGGYQVITNEEDLKTVGRKV